MLRRSEDDVGTVQSVGKSMDITVADREFCTHLHEAVQVHVDGPRAEVVAARKGDAHLAKATEQRTQHVDAGANALDQFIRCHQAEDPRVGDLQLAMCPVVINP